ncbi:exported hypothetical protein [Syntrophobacter sp. SbD1]|nr:exported hypothetical protein [Syntrophobacter sp. SbD1]
MFRIISGGVLVALLFCFVSSATGEVLFKGVVDKGLQDRNFRVTNDGFVTGEIVNTSNSVRHAVKIDMWITDMGETRIFWRKSLNIGDMLPGARYEVKEPANGEVDNSFKLEFQFRVQQKGEFRN